MSQLHTQKPQEDRPASQSASQPIVPGSGVKFARHNEFQAELRRRVDEYFQTPGRRRRDVPQMYLKTAVTLAAFATSYILLVFVARTWWQGVPLAILLGLSAAGIGFNIQHDGGHQAYSEHAWVNKLMALTLDLVGASSYLWSYKHGVYHHTYVNITHEDTDIDMGGLARLSPHQKRHWFHRWQHLYLWPLYGLFIIKWHLFDDFKDAIAGRTGDHPIPRPRGWDFVAFIIGKLLFLTLALGIPLMLHRVWVVFLFYGITAAMMGSVTSVVFQLAHAVGEAEFPMPMIGTNEMENEWAIHQAETTVDFARDSKVAAWVLGGLNFQIEHHLLPRICHINFPSLSKIVEETCRRHGVKYNQHPSFHAGLASHFKWLREMGRKNSENEIVKA